MRALADIQALVDKIKALPGSMPLDAIRCAERSDSAGLAYIVNVAEGLPGDSFRRLFHMIDLADLLRGLAPRFVVGQQ